MRCINNFYALCQKMTAGLLFIILAVILTGCKSNSPELAYNVDSVVSGLNVLEYESGKKASSFASDLCIVEGDLLGDGSINLDASTAAVLYDINGKSVVYSKNAHSSLYPASITKIMTALIAIKYGSPDQVLTASENVTITESGAQVFGLKPGDSMTLYQALRILLLYSANDVSNLIAEGICGSIDGFVAKMNEEALTLGATNTHFANPHGLTDAEHYTTAYDLYLIFKECLKYEEFTEIISMTSYESTYSKANGYEGPISIRNTNGYISGAYSCPTGVSVIGGKTGTTAAAGHCLIILAKDTNGSPFISVILQSESTESLYTDMNGLLSQVN